MSISSERAPNFTEEEASYDLKLVTRYMGSQVPETPRDPTAWDGKGVKIEGNTESVLVPRRPKQPSCDKEADWLGTNMGDRHTKHIMQPSALVNKQ